MPRPSRRTAALGLLAAAGVLLMLAASPATAKRTKHVKEKMITAPTARTPTDKTDCIALASLLWACEGPGAGHEAGHPAGIHPRRNEPR
jgi:hypothetical protein